MGGNQSVEQKQAYIEKSITDVVSETLNVVLSSTKKMTIMPITDAKNHQNKSKGGFYSDYQ